MLNGQGGFVFFGVSPDGKVKGQHVSDQTLRDVVEEFGRTEPQIVIQPELVHVEEARHVIALSVPADGRGPYRYDGRAYVRQRSTTRRVTQGEYRRRLLMQVDPSQRWEARPATGFDIDDLDHTEIIRTVEEGIRRGRMEDPGTRSPTELLLGPGLLQDGRPLDAAIVLLDTRLSSFRTTRSACCAGLASVLMERSKDEQCRTASRYFAHGISWN